MNDKVKVKKKPKNPNIVPYGPETIARYHEYEDWEREAEKEAAAALEDVGIKVKIKKKPKKKNKIKSIGKGGKGNWNKGGVVKGMKSGGVARRGYGKSRR
jgi:hypothetical protein